MKIEFQINGQAQDQYKFLTDLCDFWEAPRIPFLETEQKKRYSAPASYQRLPQHQKAQLVLSGKKFGLALAFGTMNHQAVIPKWIPMRWLKWFNTPVDKSLWWWYPEPEVVEGLLIADDLLIVNTEITTRRKIDISVEITPLALAHYKNNVSGWFTDTLEHFASTYKEAEASITNQQREIEPNLILTSWYPPHPEPEPKPKEVQPAPPEAEKSPRQRRPPYAKETIKAYEIIESWPDESQAENLAYKHWRGEKEKQGLNESSMTLKEFRRAIKRYESYLNKIGREGEGE